MKINKNTIALRAPSIFTSRNGKEDCTICKQKRSYGFTHSDGKRYASVYKIACESGEVLRGTGISPVPMGFLKDNCLID